jgi:hypothetical protein
MSGKPTNLSSLSTGGTGMPPELREMMQRYCQLGRLLPHDEAALADPPARAEAKLILEEMAQVKKRIDDFLLSARSTDET